MVELMEDDFIWNRLLYDCLPSPKMSPPNSNLLNFLLNIFNRIDSLMKSFKELLLESLIPTQNISSSEGGEEEKGLSIDIPNHFQKFLNLNFATGILCQEFNLSKYYSQESFLEEEYSYDLSKESEPSEKSLKFSCQNCGKSYSKKSSLDSHFSKCSALSSNDSVVYPKHICFYCSKNFSTFSFFQSHVETCPRRSLSDRGFVCLKCKVFVLLNESSEEQSDHPCLPFYACSKCDFKSYDRIPFRHHFLKEHLGLIQKTYNCETCGKIIRHKGDFIKHRRTHTKEKPFSCDICGKSFTRSTILNAHISSHTQQESLPCEICGKIFSSKKRVSEHARSQHPPNGIPVRYPCMHCGVSFRSKSYLARHIKNKHSKKVK